MSGTRVDEGVNKSNVLTGAKIAFYLGDQTTPVAYATALNYSITIDVAPIHTIDRFSVVEHAELSYSVTFSTSRLRIPKIGNKPGTGSPVDLGWMPKVQDIFTAGTIKARWFDKITNQDILVVDECKMTQRSGSVAARDLFTENMEFVGIIAWDEAGEQNAI